MDRLRIQVLLGKITWSTRCNIPKNVRYSDPTTQWISANFNFNVSNYGIRIVYGQMDTPKADMSFCNIIMTNSVF